MLTFLKIVHNYRNHTNDTLSTENPTTFLDLVQRISFFFGIYALILLLNVSFISLLKKDQELFT